MDLFLDNFTGSGTMDGRSPDGIGGAYALDTVFTSGGGLLADMPISGGFLGFGTAGGAPYALSAITSPAGAYAVEAKFKITGTPDADDFFDVFAGLSANSAYPSDLFCQFHLGAWKLSFTVGKSDGSTLFGLPGVTFVPTGAVQTALLVATPTNVELFLDGVSLGDSSGVVSDAYPDSVFLACFQNASSLTGGLESARLYDIPPPAAVSISFNTFRPRIFAPG